MATAASAGWAWLDEVLGSSGTFVDEPGFVDALDAAGTGLDLMSDAAVEAVTPVQLGPSTTGHDPFGWDDHDAELRGIFDDPLEPAAASDVGADALPAAADAASDATDATDAIDAIDGAPQHSHVDLDDMTDPFATVSDEQDDDTAGDLDDFDDDDPSRDPDDFDGF